MADQTSKILLLVIATGIWANEPALAIAREQKKDPRYAGMGVFI